MDVVFWLTTPSLHQAPLIRELARIPQTSVAVITSEDLPTHRKELGWTEVDFGEATVYKLPNKSVRQRLIRETDAFSVNVVSGVFTNKIIASTTSQLLSAGALVLCQTENWDSRNLKGRMRGLAYYLRLRRLARFKRSGVLAMGRDGYSAIVSHKFPKRRVAEFGYFVDSSPTVLPADRKNVVYVGGFRPGKNVFDILHLARALPAIRFDLAGSGPLEAELRAAASVLPNVRFLGVIPHSEVRALLCQYSALILPSAYDGWGVVVNEALVSGTPVVCTSGVGARSLLEADGPARGGIASVGDMVSMRALLLEIFHTAPDSLAIEQWALASASASAGAAYLHRICEAGVASGHFDLSKIVAPWRL